MNWGLFILYIFALLGLLIASNLHGQKKEGNHCFWDTLIATIIQLVLIWWAVEWRFW